MNGIDKGVVASEMNIQGLHWAVIDLCGQEAEVGAVGSFPSIEILSLLLLFN